MSRHYERQLNAEKHVTQEINYIASSCVRDLWDHDEYLSALNTRVFGHPEYAVMTDKTKEYISGYLKAVNIYAFHQKHVFGYIMDNVFFQCHTNHGRNMEITERRIPICAVWVDTVNGGDVQGLKYWFKPNPES
jgi:hypothetical protein